MNKVIAVQDKNVRISHRLPQCTSQLLYEDYGVFPLRWTSHLFMRAAASKTRKYNWFFVRFALHPTPPPSLPHSEKNLMELGWRFKQICYRSAHMFKYTSLSHDDRYCGVQNYRLFLLDHLVYKNCVIPDYIPETSGNFLPTFRVNLSVLFSKVKKTNLYI